jgi:3',5'-cyclic AMP phosphodiesterase CpdA
MGLRLSQVSDTHLGARAPECALGWAGAVDYLNRLRPDLVVNTGDLVSLDPDDEADRRVARALHGRLRVPWRVVPGNHDVGDTPPAPWGGKQVTEERRQRFRATWGPDFWALSAGDWVVAGLNSLLFGTGLDAEAEQWEWLAGLASRAGRRPLALFFHKPLCLRSLDEQEVSPLTVTPLGRRRLLSALGGANLRLVACGHVHEHRVWSSGGVLMVWAPATSYLVEVWDGHRSGGQKLLGLVDYELCGQAVSVRLVPLAPCWGPWVRSERAS